MAGTCGCKSKREWSKSRRLDEVLVEIRQSISNECRCQHFVVDRATPKRRGFLRRARNVSSGSGRCIGSVAGSMSSKGGLAAVTWPTDVTPSGQ